MSDPAAPRVFFEDITPGDTDCFGTYAVQRDEVIAFARQYDPQPFHLSDEAAAQTHFGRIAASGWHSCAMTMAMLVRQFADAGLASLGAAGVDELNWLRPVYPGDTLRVEATVLDKRRSASRPHMGIVRSRMVTFNQHDQPVLSMISNAMVALRDPAAPA